MLYFCHIHCCQPHPVIKTKIMGIYFRIGQKKLRHFTNISTLCRCSAASPDRQTCTGPSHTVLELSEGIWSEAEDNPFSDHFKVYIHSCSNDDFSGALMRVYK